VRHAEEEAMASEGYFGGKRYSWISVAAGKDYKTLIPSSR